MHEYEYTCIIKLSVLYLWVYMNTLVAHGTWGLSSHPKDYRPWDHHPETKKREHGGAGLAVFQRGCYAYGYSYASQALACLWILCMWENKVSI